MFDKFKEKVNVLKKQVTALYIAFLDKRLKWYIKIFILLIIIYAASPIDLIPDFIPIIGLLDDMILIPLGIFLALKMIPKNIWLESLEKASIGLKIDKKYRVAGAVLIILIWALIIYKVIMIII